MEELARSAMGGQAGGGQQMARRSNSSSQYGGGGSDHPGYPGGSGRYGHPGYEGDPGGYEGTSQRQYQQYQREQWMRSQQDGGQYGPQLGRMAPDPDAGKPIAERIPDAYGQLLNSIGQGRTGQGVMQDILSNFKGSAADLQQFMESPAFRSIMGFSAKNMPEYQKLQNLQDPTLQQMNVGLGQISQAGARGVQDAIGGLNQAGMGRNAGALSAVRQGGQMDTASRSALYGSSMQQQAYSNEMNKLGSLIDLENQMAQLALGFSPQPRQPSNKAGAGDWIALAGSLIGGWAGLAGAGAKKAAES
jgi:hypothetical protein